MPRSVESLQRELAQHRKNLDKLEEQKALYGLDVPLSISNAIDQEKAAIARIEALLAGREVIASAPSPAAPPPSPTVVHGDVVHGDKIGGDKVGGDKITVGDISESVVAIGRGARAEVHYHYEYVERPEPGIPYLAPGLPPHHVPREAELAELHELLLGDERQVAVAALRGMGGVGKTTLAIALCHDKTVVEAFSGGILWATLGPQANLLSAQAAWGRELGEDLTGLPDAEARTLRLRSLLHNKRCLLVIDDVWEAAHLPLMQVGGPQCVTLLTTRERKIVQKVGKAHELGVLEPGEAVALLESWADKYGAGTPDEAAELAKRLGYLPLALQLAGAQAQDGETWMNLLTAFRDVQEADVTLLDLDDPKVRDESLALTFSLSVDRLNESLQGQLAMLGVFAVGREAPFEAEAAAAVWQVTPAQARKSLRRLARAAMLDREGDNYTLHLLVGDYARGRLDEATREAAEARHNAYYLEVAQRSAEDWQAAEVALPQMRAAWGRAAKDDADGLYAWAAAAKEFFHKRGYWTESITWLEAARAAARAAGQRKHEGWCENELGYASYILGKLDQAFERFQVSLAIAREVGERKIEAQALNRIGYFHIQRGELDQAMAHLQASQTIGREVGDKAVEAESSHLTGLIYQRRGDLDEALAQYRASLAIQREGGNWQLGAATLPNIGRIYAQRGELDEALEQFRAGLDIQRKVGDRTMEGITLVFVGRIYEQRSELDQALAQFQAGLAIQREMGNKVWEAHSLNGIGRIYHQQGELDEALGQFQASLTMLREAGDRVGEAESLWNMGRTYERMGRLAEAEERLAEALALYEVIGTPEATQVREDLERVRDQLAGV